MPQRKYWWSQTWEEEKAVTRQRHVHVGLCAQVRRGASRGKRMHLRHVRLREQVKGGRLWDLCRQPTVTQVGLCAEDGVGTVETKVGQIGWEPPAAGCE